MFQRLRAMPDWPCCDELLQMLQFLVDLALLCVLRLADTRCSHEGRGIFGSAFTRQTSGHLRDLGILNAPRRCFYRCLLVQVKTCIQDG